jgi:hypothetical protein
VILTPGMFAGATTFLLGSGKHAGKTTLLNYLLHRLRGAEPLAYLSVGVDGEGRDLISGAAKPHVPAAEGDWLVTTQQALERSDASVEIREVFPHRTMLGAVAVVRVVRGGTVELHGPGGNAQLAQVLEHLATETAIRTVLVDGAINRVTPVAAAGDAACVFIVRVEPATLARSIEAIRRVNLLMRVPLADHAVESSGSTCVLAGALTTDRLHTLEDTCRVLVVDDFSHVFLTYAELQGLAERVELRVRRAVRLTACVANLRDVPRDAFLDALNDASLAERLVFNPYQEAA